jgi:hypothetical protein
METPVPQKKVISQKEEVQLPLECEYDLKLLRAPKLSGGALNTFASLLNTWPFSSVLPQKVYKDSNIIHVREFARSISHPPTYLPLKPPTQGMLPHTTKSKFWVEMKELSSFQFSDWETKENTSEGFNFSSIDDYALAYRNKVTTPLEIASKFIQSVNNFDKGKVKKFTIQSWQILEGSTESILQN